MTTGPESEYRQLEVGHEFPPASYRMEATMVSAYRQAAGEDSQLYQETELVPPTAVAAYAMTALSKSITVPPGTIHVSQELEFQKAVSVGDTITCRAKVGRKLNRGGLNLMTVELSVTNQDQKAVLAGKTSFVLPADTGGR